MLQLLELLLDLVELLVGLRFLLRNAILFTGQQPYLFFIVVFLVAQLQFALLKLWGKLALQQVALLRKLLIEKLAILQMLCVDLLQLFAHGLQLLNNVQELNLHLLFVADALLQLKFSVHLLVLELLDLLHLVVAGDHQVCYLLLQFLLLALQQLVFVRGLRLLLLQV